MPRRIPEVRGCSVILEVYRHGQRETHVFWGWFTVHCQQIRHVAFILLVLTSLVHEIGSVWAVDGRHHRLQSAVALSC